jgi:putative membrane protein insertion efficiency factor
VTPKPPVNDSAAGLPRPGPSARLLLSFVSAYRRWVSPALPPRCRFHPTCSAYAAESIGKHGAVRGGVMAMWRLLRCHPFNPGGYDPVPPARPIPQRPCPTTAPGASR